MASLIGFGRVLQPVAFVTSDKLKVEMVQFGLSGGVIKINYEKRFTTVRSKTVLSGISQWITKGITWSGQRVRARVAMDAKLISFECRSY